MSRYGNSNEDRTKCAELDSYFEFLEECDRRYYEALETLLSTELAPGRPAKLFGNDYDGLLALSVVNHQGHGVLTEDEHWNLDEALTKFNEDAGL